MMTEPPISIQKAIWNGFHNDISAPVTKSELPYATAPGVAQKIRLSTYTEANSATCMGSQ